MGYCGRLLIRLVGRTELSAMGWTVLLCCSDANELVLMGEQVMVEADGSLEWMHERAKMVAADGLVWMCEWAMVLLHQDAHPG